MNDLILPQTELQATLEAWRAKGLEPVEITRDQFYQDIHIKHDSFNGELSCSYERLDGLQAIGILFDAIVLIARRDLFAEVRGNLQSGKAAIALSLNGNTIEAIHEPANDPVVLKGLLVADLVHLCGLANERDFNPLEVLAGLMRFGVPIPGAPSKEGGNGNP